MAYAAPEGGASGVYIGKTLRRGSRSTEVKAVQKKLGITADGIFGINTEQAVKAFQGRKGLKVDGIVGTNTWRALGLRWNDIEGPSTPKPSTTTKSPSLNDKSNSAGAMDVVINQPLNMIIGGALLYGFYKILMRIF